MSEALPLLAVSDLSIEFRTRSGTVRALEKVGFDVGRGETVALVGESGSGKSVTAYALLGLLDPAARYPFELSGGMCQRVTIALALACQPALLIADEPTTGLDVTTQAVVMDLLADLAAASRMATILITHDLALAGEYADRIVVMHAGHVVESAPADQLFARPRHPYTAKLIAATPKPGTQLADLAAIPGNLPDVRRADLPACRYSARCERRAGGCAAPLPLVAVGQSHMVACWQPL
jgi:peptide/nickel transport system ATP-binding protein